MFSQLRSSKLLIISYVFSIVLHILLLTSVGILSIPDNKDEPAFTPVDIVNIPKNMQRQLPPIQQPPPLARPMLREPPLPRTPVPTPRKFGKEDDIRLPKAVPRFGLPEGGDTGKGTAKTAPKTPSPMGPLPFLTQRDIDELARKGMPEKKPGDDSVTLDTDEFKFISYNRWLKVKVESVLKYPELAAISGYQGTLFIKFDIMKDGSLGDLELLKSSGYKILDDEALRSIRDSAPFQPLPPEWKMDRYSIRAAVIFYMNEGYIR
jgi:periplasmic protein TonB